MPKPPKPLSPRRPRPSPEELAHTAVDRLERSPSGRVVMTFRVTLPRPAAEALVAESIRKEVSVDSLVEELVERAAVGMKKRAG